jgi:hypothetical protein
MDFDTHINESNVSNADIEIAKLTVRVETLQRDYNKVLLELGTTNKELLAVRRDLDKIVNRGIGAGLIIGMSGGAGGALLALARTKLGL